MEKHDEIVIHCWRGGMRSGFFTYLMEFFGIKVSVLIGGYKSYRQHVRKTFDLNYNDDEDEEEDEDDEDENYLQKFNTDINKTYITEFHPECIIHNYDEVAALSHVVKDKNGIIIDDLHKTIPFLTKYERARILGQRAKQIECGSRPFVKVPDNIVDSYIIAELELKQKKIPFIIRRPIPGGACEYWNLKDLEMVHF